MQWPNNAASAVFVNVAFEAWEQGKAPGVSPMGNPLPPGLLDTQAASWGDFGRRRGIWRLLEILERQQTQATVMASGVLVDTAPKALLAVANAGHEICAHGTSQDVLPISLNADDERSGILRCRDTIADLTGTPPVGWISPRGTPSQSTAQILSEEGFTWFGDCFDDDRAYIREFGPRRLAFIPLTMDVNDLPLRLKYGLPPAAFGDAFEQALDGVLRFADGSTHLDITVHAHVSGRPAEAAIFDKVLVSLSERSDIWITTRGEAARHVLAAEGAKK